MVFDGPPNFERNGVIAGFVLSLGAGLTPGITKGVLFAEGAMHRPVAAPALPAAPPSAQSWLFFSFSAGGLFWALSPNGQPTHALVGWVVTDSTKVILTSSQQIVLPEADTKVAVVPLGALLAQGPSATAAFGDTALPPQIDFAISAPLDATLVLQSLAVPNVGPVPPNPTENTQSIHTMNFSVYYVDEVSGVKTTLAGAISATDTVIPLASVSGLDGESAAGKDDGDLLTSEQERMKIISVDAGASTVTVKRGVLAQPKEIGSISRTNNVVSVRLERNFVNLQVGERVTIAGVTDTSFNGTFAVLTVIDALNFTYSQEGPNASSSGGTAKGTVRSHASGVSVEKVFGFGFTFPVKPRLIGTQQATDWKGIATLPGARVATVESWATNAFGDGPLFTNDYLETSISDGGPGVATGLLHLAGYSKTKQVSGGPELFGALDTAANRVALALWVKNETPLKARFLLDIQGNHEWAGPADSDQNVLLGWSAQGRLNLSGTSGGGLNIVRWTSPGVLEAQPRIALNNDGGGVKFSDGVAVADAILARSGAGILNFSGITGGGLGIVQPTDNFHRIFLSVDAGVGIKFGPGDVVGDIQIRRVAARRLAVEPLVSDGTEVFQVVNAAGTPKFGVDTLNGRVGIGTAAGAPANTLDVGGSLHVSGSVLLDSPLPIAQGGTGAAIASTARANLGAAAAGTFGTTSGGGGTFGTTSAGDPAHTHSVTIGDHAHSVTIPS